MFNLLINFCVFVFIFYAVRWSARMILSGTRRKRQVSHAAGRAHSRRRAKIIKLNVQTTKKPLRKKSSAVIVYAFFLNSVILPAANFWISIASSMSTLLSLFTSAAASCFSVRLALPDECF